MWRRWLNLCKSSRVNSLHRNLLREQTLAILIKTSRSIPAIFVRMLRPGYCCCSTTLKWTSVLLLSEDSYSHYSVQFPCLTFMIEIVSEVFRSVLDSSSLSDVRIIWSARQCAAVPVRWSRWLGWGFLIKLKCDVLFMWCAFYDNSTWRGMEWFRPSASGSSDQHIINSIRT